MATIITPLRVAFDTSVYARHINKLEHGTPDEILSAGKLQLAIQSQMCIPVLMAEHLLELCHDPRDIRQRMRWFGTLPCVAWVESAKHRGGIGSIADLVAHEIRGTPEGARTLSGVAEAAS